MLCLPAVLAGISAASVLGERDFGVAVVDVAQPAYVFEFDEVVNHGPDGALARASQFLFWLRLFPIL